MEPGAPAPIRVDLPVGRDTHWLREVALRWPVRVALRVCRPLDGRARDHLQVVEIEADRRHLPAIRRSVRAAGARMDLRSTMISPSTLYVRSVSRLSAPCREVFESGGFCLDCRFLRAPSGGGSDGWPVVLGGGTFHPAPPQGTGPRPLGTELPLRVRRYRGEERLTPRQFAALQAAYRLGFYRYPRRGGLAEVSRRLGVGRSAASELLRRAEEKAVAAELGGAPRPSVRSAAERAV